MLETDVKEESVKLEVMLECKVISVSSEMGMKVLEVMVSIKSRLDKATVLAKKQYSMLESKRNDISQVMVLSKVS